MNTKIAITIPTGRPRVKKVVKAFLDNALLYGYDLKDFSIYLSIDTLYQNTFVEDFYLDEEISSKVGKIVYITEDKRKQIGDFVNSELDVSFSVVEKIFVGNGYSKQRNSALILAISDHNDIAICLDDDEAPFVPVIKRNGDIEWANLDFFGPHIKELSSGTDITRGPYLGYKSPVPSDFEKDIPEEIRKSLGEALQYGNDVITKNSFFNLMNQIKCLSEEEVESGKAFVVKHGKHGKHIYAGNMGINLHSVREGKIPIFFTPDNARGEDTIFALQLKKVNVKEVPSYIFHDPFNMYSKIFEGEFPESLRAVPVNKETKERFVAALNGWLKYAPILIVLTSKNEMEKTERIREMILRIPYPTQELAQILDCPELNRSFMVLKESYKKVDKDCDNLSQIQSEWKKKMVPHLNKVLIN